MGGVEGMVGDEVDDFDPNEFLNVGEDDEDDVLLNGGAFGGVQAETGVGQLSEAQKPDGEGASSSIPTVGAAEVDADRSSSLSPVPADAAEEKTADSIPQLAKGADASKDANNSNDDGQKKEGGDGDDDAEKIPSRMSTPLSPLSPPPEDDDEPSETNGKEEEKEHGEYLEFRGDVRTAN
jgi:hypothetical protein